MTADSPARAAAGLRIGVVLEAFLDWPLERVLGWLPEAAPEVTHLEIGAGGYAPHPHCDVAALLASEQARSAWLGAIAGPGLQVDALNAWGNPLHPDQDLAREHDRALRDAIRRIRAEHPSHPYAAQWWPIGQGVGYGASFANQVADLLEDWPDATWTPGFREGAAVQAVCDAMEASAASGRWVMINEVTSGGNL